MHLQPTFPNVIIVLSLIFILGIIITNLFYKLVTHIEKKYNINITGDYLIIINMALFLLMIIIIYYFIN